MPRGADEPGKHAARRGQRARRALLHQLPARQHQEVVAVQDRVDSVRNHLRSNFVQQEGSGG